MSGKRFLILFLSLYAFFFFSCEKNEPIISSQNIVIYMAAENNLTPSIRQNLLDLEKGYIPEYFGHGEKGKVLLVYVNMVNEPPRLLRLSRDRYGDIRREVLMEYDEHDSVSDSVMHSVLSYAANLFPSENNGLILSSHGSGWLPEGYYRNPYVYTSEGRMLRLEVPEDPYSHLVKSFGEQDRREMEIGELKGALPVHYSFILFDACLMGGIEVAYELKDQTDYLISSAAEIMAEGFPYQSIMGPLFNSGTSGLKEVCRNYFEFYNRIGKGATVSLVKSSALTDVSASCAEIFSSGRELIPKIDMSSVQGYFRFDRHYFYDLRDFLSRIASEGQMNHLDRALDRAVVCRYATEAFKVTKWEGFEIKTFSGLSSYVPNPENKVLDRYYRSLAWNKAVQMIP